VPLAPDPSRGRELARRLLSREQGAGGAPEDIVAAGEEALRRLRRHLAHWFGSDGVDALLKRAVDRVLPERTEFDPQDRPQPDGSADELLAQHVRSCPPAEAAEATIEALAAFIALLGHLVGHDMAERLIEQSWSQAAPQQQRSEQ
jgi:hypothetical protein